MKKKVLYTGPVEFTGALQEVIGPDFEVERTEPDDSLLAKFEKADVFMDASMKVRVPASTIEKAANLKLIVTATTGADHIDQKALAARNIPILTLSGQKEFLKGLSAAAEHSWLLLLAVSRKLRSAIHHVEGGGWDRVQFPGIMMRNRTLGVIGMGRIGSLMARYARAFEMNVLGYDSEIKEFSQDATPTELDLLLATSDIVTIHIPRNDATKNFFDAKKINMMKKGAILINTSGGSIIDEEALVKALEEGRVAGVGTDVLDTEPKNEDSPLWRHAKNNENVIITPHIGGFCPEAVGLSIRFSGERILKYYKENNLL
ncbi:hypothetical protein A3I27_02645 [Candidatus Giovannonibacteria bacterium RIFCSPLOWO2_02_FULL_43_11b]|uniref:Hydroxyacid dehydrogenase n=1 Tax=Candidatus Giovannonibacteria bacterium RIFCSPHIGHO2_12_FULL_43_15 TaxID=1798341 RepID=A0A1F5WNY9_9BACT|nr:MAG: hypothetical protein A2739_03335 [Candidatus Giovannonibacteria bacterium RIFCSPHIGHO2_01_FULL_43_100]OGF66296.1 MAG: hypothetical protein A3B97_01830 [Candidatus Giovannonibacteria bacterium RIFCSPHIGHO2_02_FULL_43_32]OGF77366.1 MAG: hypothetical protein A3F23_00250 [Candidatus Giovannonibacteria bacterium RIFCSPHIGHO2_12_FULL_43_15]OGF79189.1 MAG: hypothetical protein A3A15_01015 [Candidatus Giovannonibacteria bacterium RIFCSPLOWO2_01_FULL_43_60]OGF90537.1 MAG: hypothetical protein A3